MMRFLKLFLAALLVFALLALPVSAAEPEYSISLPNGYISATSSQDKSQLAEVFGISEQELKQYYEKYNVLFAAATSDNLSQVRLFKTEDSFSKRVDTFSAFTDSQLNELILSSFEGGKLLVNADKTKYICISKQLSDSGGGYTVTEYITVKNKAMYTLSITEAEGVNTSSEIFSSFKIHDEDAVSKSYTLYYILMALGIAVFASGSIICIVLIIRDLKKRNTK